jgi:hypothetical protein
MVNPTPKILASGFYIFLPSHHKKHQKMSTLDVLTLIKGAIEAKVAHKIYSEDSEIFIPTSTGTKQFVATGKTSYRRKDRNSKEFLTIGGLYDLLQHGLHTGGQYTDYKKKSKHKNKVGVLDWYELKRYLTGEVETTKQVTSTGGVDNEDSDNNVATGEGSNRGIGGGGEEDGQSGGSGSSSSLSSSAQSSQLLMAAERSLKRKRELIEASGMSEEEAAQCASRARSQETNQVVTRQNVLNDVQADYTEVIKSMQAVTRKAAKKKEKSEAPSRIPKYPIILVSESTSKAKISMWNILQFLGEGTYVSIKDAKSNAGRGAKEPRVLTLLHNNVTFRILPIGITSKKDVWSANDYSRVVGLFADGSTWAYKGWPMETVDVFNSTAGFHLFYADEKPHANCKQWIVEKIAIDKYKRHNDAVAVGKIWNCIDHFISSKMPEYLPENWKNPHMK